MRILIIFLILSVTEVMAENLLKVGSYSWYGGGATASLSVKKDRANGYAIFGEAIHGVISKYGPNRGKVSITGFLKKGVLHYVEGRGNDKYALTLKVRKDGSFDIHEKGLTPLGSHIPFSGHFTSDNNPSFNCAKAKTFTEKAICDNQGIARLDRKMAIAYSLLKSGFFYKNNRKAKVKALKTEQRAWGKKRNECKKKSAYLSCYERLYFERIEHLNRAFEYSMK